MPFPVHTYSIVARDAQTGQMGVAVQSHYFSVGSRVPHAEAGVGAVATQSRVNVDYGPEGLALMRRGLTAPEALAEVLRTDEGRELRQVAMVDARGNVAAHTGSQCVQAAGHLPGNGFSVQANLMVDPTVWPAMKEAYEQGQGELVDRLVAALEAAQASGGDLRGQQSAAILVVSGEKLVKQWQGILFDLRVEDHPRPVEELKRLVQLARAYQLRDLGAELLAEGRHEEAMGAFNRSWELAPEIVEMKFWPAVNLFVAGREEQALRLFREVFARETLWADLIPRMVAARRFPDDPAALARVEAQRPRPASSPPPPGRGSR